MSGKKTSFKESAIGLIAKAYTLTYNNIDRFDFGQRICIDRVFADHIKINSHVNNGFLFGIEVSGNSNAVRQLTEKDFNDLIYSVGEHDSNAFLIFNYVKKGIFQKVYAFSFDKTLIENVASFLGCELLSGFELCNALLDIMLLNDYSIEDKNLIKKIDFNEIKDKDEPDVIQIANSIIRDLQNSKKYKNTQLWQAWQKTRDPISHLNILELFRLDFNFSVFFRLEFGINRKKNTIKALIRKTMLSDQASPYKKFQKHNEQQLPKLSLANISVFLDENCKESDVFKIMSKLQIKLVNKEFVKKKILSHTPLVRFDDDYDLFITNQNVANFLITIHRKSFTNGKVTNVPDIYGLDLYGAFIAYNTREQNDSGHKLYIGRTGSGKTTSLIAETMQTMNANTNDLTFNQPLDGIERKVRFFDKGWTAQRVMNAFATNKENNVLILDGTLDNFKYNLMNFKSQEDIALNIEIMNTLLEVNNEAPILGNELAYLRQAITSVLGNLKENLSSIDILRIKNRSEQDYEEIRKLGFKDTDKLISLPDKFSYYKKPLMEDLFGYISILSKSSTENDNSKNDISNLERKLNVISSFNSFSTYDSGEIGDAKVLYLNIDLLMEDKSIFVPALMATIEKIYRKDRALALWYKSQNREDEKPLISYKLAEMHNYYNYQSFNAWIKIKTKESRKFGIDITGDTQNLEDIPKEILKNMPTKIYMSPPDKRDEMIADIKQYLTCNEQIEFVLKHMPRRKGAMCIVDDTGQFGFEFQLTQKELKLYS